VGILNSDDEYDGTGDASSQRAVHAREGTTERIVAAIHRRAADLPHRFAWNADHGFSRTNRERLRSYRDRHRGQRCFILGGGPSLTKLDLSPLSNEITFGVNRVYRTLERLDFQMSYYCAASEHVVERYSEEIEVLPMPKFLDWRSRALFDRDDETICFLRQALPLTDFFALDITQAICSGGTINFIVMEIAFYMGFHEVILLGADHAPSDNAAMGREREVEEDHFHPDFVPRGPRGELPELLRSEAAYHLAKAAFEADGRKILDATEGGQLRVFEKVEYASLFRDALER